MTTKLKERIENIEAELAALKKDLEEPKEWPQFGDDYWYIYTTKAIRSTLHEDGIIGKRRVELGNCFRTEAEAQHYGDFLLVMAKLRRAAKGFKHKTGGCSWSLSLYKSRNVFSFVFSTGDIDAVIGEVRFKTEQDGLDLIESLTDAEKATLLKGWPT